MAVPSPMSHHFGPGNNTSPASRQPSDAADRDDEDAWSAEESVAEDGSRKRKRVRRPISVSCELCKQRKVKCDRGQPQCGWCLRNGQVCEYRERKKPGLRAGYGRELEGRLDRLENALESQQQLLHQLAASLPSQQNVDHSPMAAHVSHAPLQEAPLYMQRPPQFRAATSTLDAKSPQNYGTHRHSTNGLYTSQQPPLARMQSTSSAHDSYAPTDPPLEAPSLNIPGTAQNGVVTTAPDGDLPPYDLLYALVDLFFKHINTWCPILHRQTTRDALFGSSGLDEADRILLHAMVATTLRFSTDARLNEPARSQYHDRSKQKVLLYGLENSSVKSLQALVILALDIVGSSNGPPGWNLLALITRSVVQLGLAVETTSTSVSPLYPSIYTLRAMVLPDPRDFIEDESRRRLFWMVYLLDRYATIATAFDFALDDKEIDRKLPCRDDLFARNQTVDTRFFVTPDRTDYSMNHPENFGSFGYYIEILGILSRIHLFLKKPVDIGALHDVEQWQREYRQLDNSLEAWKFNLPTEYGNSARIFSPNESTRHVNAIWIMLHVTYHTTVIRLHSSAAYPTTRSPIFTPSYSASQHCQNAVEDICNLCTYVRNNSMLPNLGPPFAFSLWVAARLLLVHNSTIDHKLNPAIHDLVATLREMGPYWQVAERYATLIQRVLDEYSESERQPADANGERVTPSTVRILADMRRCAYDLDFLISRQPRQLPGAAKGMSITPRARTPAPNELEYLDVFDFFNLPRLPAPAEVAAATTSTGVSAAASANGNGAGNAGAGGSAGEFQLQDLGTNNEFNITNFMYDANSDWFMRNPS